MGGKTVLWLTCIVACSYVVFGAAGLNCTVAETCPSGHTRLMGMQSTQGSMNNSHAQTTSFSSYNYSLCCESTIEDISVDATCGTTFLRLSNGTNAHVQTPTAHSTTYADDVCISSSSQSVSCTYQSSACGTECLVSMASSEGDNTTNAHVASCGYYPQRVCCGIINNAPTVSSSLAGAHLRTPYSRHWENLIGYWQFEGNTSDAVGNSADGSVIGSVENTSEGRVGAAYRFDTGDVIRVSENSVIDETDALTVAGWIKFKDDGTGGCLASRYDYGTDNRVWELCFNETYYPLAAVDDDGTLNLDKLFRSDTALQPNTWHHLAFTFHNDDLDLYIDGSSASVTADRNLTVNTLHDSTVDLIFNDLLQGGVPSGSTENSFNGTIDEIAMFNRSLTAQEMQQLYNETRGTRDFTNNNLAASPQNVTDPDGDTTTTIFDWRRNGASIATLNLPFNTEITSDASGAVQSYSDLDNDATLRDTNGTNSDGSTVPQWNASCVRGGCYQFDGVDDEIEVETPGFSVSPSEPFSIATWVYLEQDDSEFWNVVTLPIDGASNGFELLISSDGTLGPLSFGSTSDSFFPVFGRSSGSYTDYHDTWTHIVLTYDGSDATDVDSYTLYHDGAEESVSEFPNIYGSTGNTLKIGRAFDDLNYWNGSIDEIIVFNRSLTSAQVTSLYNQGLSSYATIDSAETRVGENWSARVWTSDETNISTGQTTNTIYIQNTNVSAPDLLTPQDGNTSWIDRTPNFDWTEAYDPDQQPITYRIELALDSSFSTIVTNTTTTDTNYSESTLLDIDSPYYWRVTADDTVGTATSNTSNFTITSFVNLSLVNAAVDFGTLQAGSSENTTDDSPSPFLIENSGNLPINLSINATQLFDQAALNTSNYQYRARNSSELGSFDYASSTTTFANFTATSTPFLNVLNFTDASDTAEIDIDVNVPNGEPRGTKNSTVVVTGVAS